MKYIRNLLLIISTLFFLGCSTTQEIVVVPKKTPVRPICFTEETKEWLEGLEWPHSAYGDFDKIRKLNKVLNIDCDELRAAQ